MIRHNFLIMLAALVLLNACAELPKNQPQPPARVVNVETVCAPSNTELLLNFAEHFIDLSLESQKKELTQTSQVANQNKQDINSRIKVAMIYALPNSKLRDSGKAQFLLEELIRDKTVDKERKSLVGLLADYTNDTNKLALKARDEQKRGDTLQQQLDELKNIERTMVDRDQRIRK